MSVPTLTVSELAARLPDRRFCHWMAGAAALDLTTKWAAGSYLSDRFVPLGERFGLNLVFNTGGPGGYTIGPATWYVNVIVTLVALLMMLMVARQLGKIHWLGAVAIGMVSGGAFGNLASMLTGPAGVADFIVVNLEHVSLVLNVADLALWTGAVLLIPVVYRLVCMVRKEASVKAMHARRRMIAQPRRN